MSEAGGAFQDQLALLETLAAEAVKAILSDERWFQGPVISWASAPTAEFAALQRGKKVKRLRRSDLCSSASYLAEDFNSCREGARCLSGACYICGRVFQQWVARESSNLADKSAEPFQAINIVMPQHQVPAGELSDLDMAELRETLTGALAAAGFEGMAYLALDLSLNDDTQRNNGGIYWQPHFRGIISHQRPGFARKLARALGHNPSVHRPVMTREYDGSYYGGSYTFKTYFERRVRYLKMENGRFRTRTSKSALKAAEDIESMLYLHELGFYQRLYLRNIEILVDGNAVSMRQLE